MAIKILCFLLIILGIIVLSKKLSKNRTYVCVHTKLDCENCMSQKNCTQQHSEYLVEQRREHSEWYLRYAFWCIRDLWIVLCWFTRWRRRIFGKGCWYYVGRLWRICLYFWSKEITIWIRRIIKIFLLNANLPQ